MKLISQHLMHFSKKAITEEKLNLHVQITEKSIFAPQGLLCRNNRVRIPNPNFYSVPSIVVLKILKGFFK